MKFILKSLINTLRRFRLAWALNLLGLSIAFTVFTVIMIQVSYERSFDAVHPTSDRVFRVTTSSSSDVFSIILSRPFVEEIIQSSPHIVAGTLVEGAGDVYFSANDGNHKKGFRGETIICSPDITEVFDFPIVEGDKACLENQERVIISQSLAIKLFGNESSIGKALHSQESLLNKKRRDFVVGAVYKDFPENTQLKNGIYMAIDPEFAMNQWYSSNYICYLLLDDVDMAQNVEENFNNNFDFAKLNPDGFEDENDKIMLTPLREIYYLEKAQGEGLVKSGDRGTMRLIIAIAVLIIGVAAANFMNFSISLAPVRIKSINTQKVLGCSLFTLRVTLILETVFMAMISFLSSLIYIWLLNKVHALPFIEADISLINNISVIMCCGLLFLFIGLIVGLYPAFYMTSFPPALTLKGNFGLSMSGRKLRNVLIGFQFIVSIGLIIAASFIWLQNKYMHLYSPGFDKDQIAIVELNSDIYEKHKDYYVNRLKNFSGIDDVAFSLQKLGGQDSYATTSAMYNQEKMNFFYLPVSWNFFRVMGITTIEGREPNEDDQKGGKSVIFFNGVAKKAYGLQLNTNLDFFANKPEITGFIENVKLTSLRKGPDCICFLIGGNMTMKTSYIRLKAGTDYVAAIDHIRNTLLAIDPSFPVKIEFYDMLFDSLYHKEENLKKMVTTFSMLAILISIVGVFGMIIFETLYRRKEIGIRKVFGSSISEILLMFNRIYIRIVLVCFAICIPFVYWGISRWLEGFVYKISIDWWIFLLGGAVVLTVVVLVVSLQSWRAANANPTQSLKNE